MISSYLCKPMERTEILQIKVSPEEKETFKKTCKKKGKKMSEVLRSYMERYINTH